MLVFSSAEMTNSSFLRGLPFQERSYRSRMRLALTAKPGFPWEDPTAVVPGANGVFMEPSPKGTSGDGGSQAGLADLAGKVRSVPAGKGNPISSGQLTSQRLNLNDQFWGKKPGAGPGGSARA